MCKEYSTAKWLFVGASFWCSATSAGVWTVAPGLELQETYTDNVELSAPGLEKSEYITSIVPTLGVIGQGGNFEFSLDYRLERLLYSDNAEFDNTYHQLQSMFKSELVDETFFVEMDGRLDQQIIDPQEPVASSNVFVTGNRTNVVGFSVSPYFNTKHSDGSQILIRPTFGWNKYEDLENLDNKISRYEFLYQQNRPENNHGWLFRINSTRVDYDNGNKTELGLVNLEGRVRIYRRLNLVAGIGYEDNEYDRIVSQQSIDGSNWTLGLSWRPSRRTSIEMHVGERFFGSTGSFSLNRRGRNSQWNIFYEESVDAGGQATTSTSSVLDSGIVPDPEVSIVERLSFDYSYDLS
ncbi:MAG: TIGR03016 family PEP-CTERM system-associated outer membrane protein, partial [Gammaproteobacteria bacterium]|nr:TIGR03016 family PEP-CTERM system-associated outer membrane protein [Gammaproteobacteria bacterium]